MQEIYSNVLDRENVSSDEMELYFTFGIIADVQYADTVDSYNFTRTRKRYYRQSLHLFQSAIEEWNKEAQVPSFILQLGDIIDGINFQLQASDVSLQRVLNEVGKCKAAFHHVWGNHEFYNFSRDYLTNSELNSKCLQDHQDSVSTTRQKCVSEDSDSERYYAYHFCPFHSFRFLMVDCYDLSIIGRKPSSKKYQDSMKILKEKNPNTDLNSPEGLLENQFVQYNGGFSKEQLKWLDGVLTFSDENRERVVIFGHLPIHPDSTDTVCLAWNYTEMLSLLQSHTCVVCYIAGHDHDGGYCLDSHGIHYITVPGIIETPPGSHAFGTVQVYEGSMILKGRGSVSDRIMHYRKE